MTRLSWNAPSERFFEAGLDRGVLYPKKAPTLGPELLNIVKQPRPAGVALNPLWVGLNLNGSLSAVQAYTSWALTTPGAQWTAYFKIRNTHATDSFAVTAGGSPTNGVGNFTGSPTPARLGFTIPPGGTQIYRHVFTVPVTDPVGIRAFMSVSGANSANAIGTVFIDECLMVAGNYQDSFFDGDTEDTTKYQYSWIGTVDGSESKRQEMVGSAAVWNGLTSVDEGGSEGAVSYYIDGQAFMHFPTPKEFTATVKAYTYPDEFAEILGLVEVDGADGLFADSQVGEQFDMCYRTLVGNGTDGLDHGYKIHLVYNAIATPQSTSYETLSMDISPAEFSWELSAVPEMVEGYRPTAHFVIDTRKMTPAILAKIEDMLYGSSTEIPTLPDPIDVIELLTYGGAIVIVDNGDGTWSAMGSRHDIYLLDEDTFQIDNVEMIDYGDGFFGVTTTPA